MLGGAGIGYVWQKEQIDRLSQRIHERELRLAEQREENENRRKQLANLRSPAFLEKKIRELNLGLTAPQPTQVWRLADPPRSPADGRVPLAEEPQRVGRTNSPPGT